jgi:hypothetical protein
MVHILRARPPVHPQELDGYCTYIVRFENEEQDYVACEVQANRNPKQYRENNDSYDGRMALWLIDIALLGRDTEMPVPLEPLNHCSRVDSRVTPPSKELVPPEPAPLAMTHPRSYTIRSQQNA